MNKFDVLAVTGKLTVKFGSNERSLKEIENLQKFISENDFVNSAICFGRVCEILSVSEISENKDIQAIYEYISVEENFKEMSMSEMLNLNIRQLGLSNKAYRALKDGGVNTVGDIVSLGKTDIKLIWSIGEKTFSEIDSQLKKIGIDLK